MIAVQVPPAENLTVDQMKDILFEAGIRFSMTIRRPALCQLYNQQFFSTKVQKMTHDHHSDVRSDRRALAGVTGDTGGDTIARRRMRGILPPTRDEGKYYTRTNDELLRLLEPFGLDDQRMTHEDLVKLCRLYHHKIGQYCIDLIKSDSADIFSARHSWVTAVTNFLTEIILLIVAYCTQHHTTMDL